MELNDVEQMDESPDEPGDEAGNMNSENVGDGSSAADDRHVSLVEVFKWSDGLSGEARFDGFGRVGATLDGDLRDSGELVAFLVEREREIPENENFRVVGQREIWRDLEAAGAVGFGFGAFGDFSREWGGGDAARPKDRTRRDGASYVVVAKGDAIGVDMGDHGAEFDFNAETRDELLGFGGKIFGIGRKDTRAAFEEQDLCFLRSNAAEIVLESLMRDFCESAGEFQASGAGTDNDEGEPGACFSLRLGALGTFERIKKLVAHGGRFFDALEAGSIFAPVVVAVIRGLRTGGDEERIVGKDAAVGEGDHSGDGVEIDCFAEEHLDIFLAAEHRAEWGGDLGGGERSGGDLIEQRLEEMEVAAVEQGDLDAGIFEALRGDKASEASTKNQDAVIFGHERFPSPLDWMGCGKQMVQRRNSTRNARIQVTGRGRRKALTPR